MKVKYEKEFLLSKGIKVNKEGGWLLHYPAFIEDQEPLKQIFLELIERFADDHLIINLVDNSGKTALHYAAMYGNETIVNALLVRMSPEVISLIDKLGKTALEYAHDNHNREIFEQLLPLTEHGQSHYSLDEADLIGDL